MSQLIIDCFDTELGASLCCSKGICVAQGHLHHLARLYMDWSTIGAFPLSHLRFKVSGKEFATTSCHIVGVTYGALGVA